ncbi:hypothetical protein GCM10023194_60630 [Planotetraspora phitsanulokensis]|uniref:Orc1-like AAA ATPase domain-containing protein n=1 Tax=Planotetraspora phitsanulokensis TaxID=575192 RepID=A0A8J3XEY5_9ACTN|nr:AAA family ATPase [Planotetraspora phitsanulokensis]GII37716.1 hypothetical protein Pph01_27190 [Planotetraspora phitsanulokensis]
MEMRIDGVTHGLIGRDHPAAMLRAEIGRAADSHGGLVLVTGEAGIGKTTLVTDAADTARRLGALVLGGSCWDSDNAPGYWPWVQVLRGVRRSVTPGEWSAAEDAARGGLAALLGESPSPDVVDGFHLYDAVTSALVSISQSRPVVVVLDDLHWADAASLKLLEFAAQHTWFERLLLVGTYRDVEVEHADHPLRPFLLPLASRATTITLTGLDRDGVGALMARTTGHEPAADLVAEVHRRTGGNPFFVEQTARLWRSGGSVTAIAPGVRDTLLRRLSLLPRPVVELLTTAAVLGREFHRQVLAATAAAPVAHVDRLLGQAVTARLVAARGGASFAFAHDLVRETLYESLGEEEASLRHAAVIRAVDRTPDLADRTVPADLARHAHLAGGHVETARTVELLVGAAHHAVRRLATEEAAGHYRRALDLAVDGSPRQRVMIAIDFGRELCHSGDSEVGRRAFEEAAVVAREADDPELLARVALSIHGARGRHDPGQMGADLLRQAHRRLVRRGSPDDLPLDRVAQDLAVQIAVLARRDDDDEALAFGLWARHDSIWGPGTAPERAALTEELLTLARRTSDVEMESYAAALRWVALLEQGDPRYLDQFDAYIELGRRDETPLLGLSTSTDLSIICALMGRFDEAQTHLNEVAEVNGRLGHDHFAFMLDHHRWAVRLLQGRFDDLEELHRVLLRSRHPCPGLLQAMTELRRGDVEPALRYLAEANARGESRERLIQPLWLRFQAMVAAASRDPELCEKARADLEPHIGTWAVAMYGWDIGGPMVLWLALVDAAQERWDEAVDGFTQAWHSADRLRARPWSIEARTHLAEALLARRRAGDAETAGGLLDDVETEAAQIGMPHIVETVQRLRAAPRPAKVVHAPSQGDTFARDGEVWTLGFAGRTVHLPDAKGLRDLQHLLSRPGTDVSAVELLDPEGGALVVAARRMGGDPILDEEAKARYRRRLAQLDEEIDRAAGLGDDRRAADFDREREALLDELRAAAGLGGRDRRLGDEAERARKTVTARIRDVLRKLDRLHPELAEHLRAAVSTGATCRYQPDREISWRS